MFQRKKKKNQDCKSFIVYRKHQHEERYEFSSLSICFFIIILLISWNFHAQQAVYCKLNHHSTTMMHKKSTLQCTKMGLDFTPISPESEATEDTWATAID